MPQLTNKDQGHKKKENSSSIDHFILRAPHNGPEPFHGNPNLIGQWKKNLEHQSFSGLDPVIHQQKGLTITDLPYLPLPSAASFVTGKAYSAGIWDPCRATATLTGGERVKSFSPASSMSRTMLTKEGEGNNCCSLCPDQCGYSCMHIL